MSEQQTKRCRPSPDRAVCSISSCTYADGIGSPLAATGRAQLRSELQRPTSTTGCDCAECADHPMTPGEVDGVLDHVSEREAVLFALGKAVVSSFVLCDHCGVWVPVLWDSVTATPGTLAAGGCPYHG